MRRSIILALVIVSSVTTGAFAFQAPIAGVPYQIPPGFGGYGAGTIISYGSYNYVVQNNGTMLLAADQRRNPFNPGPSVNPSVVDQTNYQYRLDANGNLVIDRNRLNVNESAFDPQRNQEIPGTRRFVKRLNPDGSVTSGWTWYSYDGKPRSELTTTRPNGTGGMDRYRVAASPGPGAMTQPRSSSAVQPRAGFAPPGPSRVPGPY